VRPSRGCFAKQPQNKARNRKKRKDLSFRKTAKDARPTVRITCKKKEPLVAQQVHLTVTSSNDGIRKKKKASALKQACKGPQR